jgi:hypothetical protein
MRFRAIWNFLSSAVTIAIIAFVLMGFFSNVTPIDVDMIKRVCGDNDKNCVTCDAYWIAVQIGRLDIISICLAILGVTVGLSAVFGFLYVKEKSEMLAAEAAEKTINSLSSRIEEKIERNAIKFMEEQLPKIAQDYVELAASSKDAGRYADEIAGEMDNGDRA